MIERWLSWVLPRRNGVIAATFAFAVVAALAAQHLRLDALPDITSNQVIVLTQAPGFTPEEVERLVTRRVEATLGGVAGLESQRSLSRYGISSVTAVFHDSVDPYRARQVVSERLASLAAELPSGVAPPELAPLTGGLGEIFHFTLTSPIRTPAQLLELADLRLAPLLRAVSGVVEVNTWGGAQRTFDVIARPRALAAHKLTVADVADTVQRAVGRRAGATVATGAGQTYLRGASLPRTASDLGAIPIRGGDGALLRVADVATLREGNLPRLGAATANGRGEVVYVMVQMLRDANALEVMAALHARMPAVRAALPKDVRVTVVYDRSQLVGATLHTVGSNLLEGGLLVIFVLFAMLGSLRAGLLVALTIPLSMLGALAGMVLLGMPGNLMSLGAIDFGLLVDGAVVLVEQLFHDAVDVPHGDRRAWRAKVESVSRSVGRPVFFSVLVILLVYVPIIALTGVDGKLFRPMAVTVILALTTAMALSLSFIPAAASRFLRPQDIPARPPLLVRWAQRLYAPQLRAATNHPAIMVSLALAALTLGGWLFARAGSDFIPQLDEGDLVIQTERSPHITIQSAIHHAARMEAALLAQVPEVERIASRIGSPAVATDIMGLEQADVFVGIKPRAQWRPGLSRDALIAEMEQVLAKADPHGEPAFTQPIQMRFNELLAGAVSDVTVEVFGPELDALRAQAVTIADALRGMAGLGDVRILSPPDVALTEVRPRMSALQRYKMSPEDVLQLTQAVRAGVHLASTWDGPREVPIRLKVADGGGGAGHGKAGADALASLQVPTPAGSLLPLGRLAEIHHSTTSSRISHDDAQRRVVVGFNVRGGDLGSVVTAAKARVAEQVTLQEGYRVRWGGQHETLARARGRMAVVLPMVLLLVLLLLVAAFRALRPALIILLEIPFAGVGGIVFLTWRGLPVSISALIGFIALTGIAVLNGVVLMNRVRALEAQGLLPTPAMIQAATERMRPVLMTALVASLGFVPMMLATGTGAEVQRPLATVVVGGLGSSTALTLLVLPAVYRWLAATPKSASVG